VRSSGQPADEIPPDGITIICATNLVVDAAGAVMLSA